MPSWWINSSIILVKSTTPVFFGLVYPLQAFKLYPIYLKSISCRQHIVGPCFFISAALFTQVLRSLCISCHSLHSLCMPPHQSYLTWVPESSCLFCLAPVQLFLGNPVNFSTIQWAVATPSTIRSEFLPWGQSPFPSLSFLGYFPSALGGHLAFSLHLYSYSTVMV